MLVHLSEINKISSKRKEKNIFLLLFLETQICTDNVYLQSSIICVPEGISTDNKFIHLPWDNEDFIFDLIGIFDLYN